MSGALSRLGICAICPGMSELERNLSKFGWISAPLQPKREVDDEGRGEELIKCYRNFQSTANAEGKVAQN